MTYYHFYWWKHKKQKPKTEDDDDVPISKRKIKILPISKIAGKLFLIYILVVLISGFILSVPRVVLAEGRNVSDGQGKHLGYYNFSWN